MVFPICMHYSHIFNEFKTALDILLIANFVKDCILVAE